MTKTEKGRNKDRKRSRRLDDMFENLQNSFSIQFSFKDSFYVLIRKNVQKFLVTKKTNN